MTVSGRLRVPASKSVTHRAYVLAASSPEPSTIADPLRGADTNATLGCLHRLGHRFQLDERTVQFLPSVETPPSEALDCRNAGTALRLLMPHAARNGFPVSFTGDQSLSGRPNGPLVSALRQLGATASSDDTLPLTVQGPLRNGTVRLPPRCSSQYASGLMLALAQVPGDSELILEPPVASKPYIQLTASVAASFGIELRETANGYSVPGGQVPRAAVHRVEGDWSTAAFPLAAAAITGGAVQLEGLDPQSLQGDRAIIDQLQAFGCHVHVGDGTISLEGRALESPGAIDVSRTPDMFPALAIVAACATGTTTFTGGAALRDKESDRIAAMAAGLATLGIDVQEAPDGITITGGTLGAGLVHAFHDHRIHMAFTIAGLAANGKVQVDGAESVAVSYPDFHADLASLLEVA